MYGPTYDNRGFQHEQTRPPPYDQRGIYPQLPQEPPNYVAFAPQTINTHQTSTPGIPNRTTHKKGNIGLRLSDTALVYMLIQQISSHINENI